MNCNIFYRKSDIISQKDYLWGHLHAAKFPHHQNQEAQPRQPLALLVS